MEKSSHLNASASDSQAAAEPVDQATSVVFDQPCPADLKGSGENIPMPQGRGMVTPWEEIQAEDAETNGKIIGPCRLKWSYAHIEAEAIGRKAVVLQHSGDYVRFKPKTAHNSIVIRYSVPDTAGGGGQEYSLGLYVNGSRVKSLKLTSEYSWNYQGQLLGNPVADTPAAQPHTFFDEAHYLFPETHNGDTIELRREGGDDAAFYVIDLADFEQVAPPAQKPDGFISVEDYGIHPDDGLDHAADLERVLFINPQIGLDPLHNVRKLWFPPGKYIIKDFKAGVTNPNASEQEKAPLYNEGIDCHNCEIRGAGMWYTELSGRRAMFFCLAGVNESVNSGGCHFQDFRMNGVTKTRSEEIEGPQKAFAGPLGMQSTIDHVWIEHVVAGIWVGNDPPNQAQATENLKITNCRIRNTYADGINFANGTSNSSVENCHIRSTGDDGIAVWSVNWPDWVKERTFVNPGEIRQDALNAPGQGVGHGNTFSNISVQMPWRANCFAFYGGHSNTVQNSTCEDVLTYPGIMVDNEFSPYDFGAGISTFRNITLNRAGGTMFYESTANPWHHAAIQFYTREGNVNDILLEDIDVISPTYAGIEFRGFGPEYRQYDPVGTLDKIEPGVLAAAAAAKITNVTLRNVKVVNPGTTSVELLTGAGVGDVTLDHVQISEPYLYNETANDPNQFFHGKFLDLDGQEIQNSNDLEKRRADAPGSSAIADQLYDYISFGVDKEFVADKDSIWAKTTAQLDADWAIISPEGLWGAAQGSLPVVLDCAEGNPTCDKTFKRKICRTNDDCFNPFTSCQHLRAAVSTPGGAAPTMCLGGGDSLLNRFYDVMVSADRELDITSLNLPSGRFRATMVNALAVVAQKNQPTSIRMLFGADAGIFNLFVPTQSSANKSLANIIEDVTTAIVMGSSIRLESARTIVAEKSWSLAWRANLAGNAWNHSKIVSADGRRALTGGHNMWDGDYLGSEPVFDLSMEYSGPAAVQTRNYVNALWNMPNYIASYGRDTSPLAKLPDFTAGGFSNESASTKVLTVGRMGGYGRNASDLALSLLVQGARDSVKIAQQDIYQKWTASAGQPIVFKSLTDAANRGVNIKIVDSNQGAGYGVYSPRTGYRKLLEDVVQSLMTENHLSRAAAERKACLRISYEPFTFSRGVSSWDGQQAALSLHSKFIMVDESAFYIGSHNLYPADLQEYGVIVADAGKAAELKAAFWDKMWNSGSPFDCPYLNAPR